MKYIIEVTQKDIDNGKSESEYCPIARAVRRTLKIRDVAVSISFGLELRGKRVMNIRGTKLEKFIRNFDYKLPVKPFIFNFSI